MLDLLVATSKLLGILYLSTQHALKIVQWWVILLFKDFCDPQSLRTDELLSSVTGLWLWSIFELQPGSEVSSSESSRHGVTYNKKNELVFCSITATCLIGTWHLGSSQFQLCNKVCVSLASS